MLSLLSYNYYTTKHNYCQIFFTSFGKYFLQFMQPKYRLIVAYKIDTQFLRNYKYSFTFLAEMLCFCKICLLLSVKCGLYFFALKFKSYLSFFGFAHSSLCFNPLARHSFNTSPISLCVSSAISYRRSFKSMNTRTDQYSFSLIAVSPFTTYRLLTDNLNILRKFRVYRRFPNLRHIQS